MTDGSEENVGAEVSAVGLALPPPADPAGDARRELAEQLVEEAKLKGLERLATALVEIARKQQRREAA